MDSPALFPSEAPKRKPVVICVDDEPAVLESLRIELRRALGEDCLIETAEDGEDALALMSELQEDDHEIALVLSDYIMPNIKGDELLARMHQMSPNTLKIMLTGQANLEAVGNALKLAKLYRYMAKPWTPEDLKVTVLEAVHSYLQDRKLDEQNYRLQLLNEQLRQANIELERVVNEQAAIIAARTAELQAANKELMHLSVTDPLTELPNRRYFDAYLRQEWLVTVRDRQFLSLILADVDYFKAYNDHYGHHAGDLCLQQVAQVLQQTVQRPRDCVARYGGEEFVIVLPHTDLSGAELICRQIQHALQQCHIVHEHSQVSHCVTLSFGVASLIPLGVASPLELFNAADKALYDAKRQGRNCIVVNSINNSPTVPC
ncbi:diguanylate cyclase response regulator [Parathermosynechococcus lividus PCC 6715]|uniref:Diguanylate cyclase response regulator n=1 Tax=Parathermosynechococcus lividus PCC 6715 TaxID=1917166 RepID=A0A2D2Q3Z1_PARLV|nr:diguanylate cyclase [Thermostichus lividus]ATS19244.1 diguanylate cyclase response regulator [Thermostichus lividus PCC 6715]